MPTPDETPESSPDGLFEGMPVSVIAGECWKSWRENTEGFHVIPAERIAQIGLHDGAFRVDRTRRVGVGHLVDPVAVQRWGFEDAFLRALVEMSSRSERAYVHIDTHVIDAGVMRASLHASPGGPTPQQLVWAVERIAETLTIETLNFTSYDTAVDEHAPGILVPMIHDIVKVVQDARAAHPTQYAAR